MTLSREPKMKVNFIKLRYVGFLDKYLRPFDNWQHFQGKWSHQGSFPPSQ